MTFKKSNFLYFSFFDPNKLPLHENNNMPLASHSFEFRAADRAPASFLEGSTRRVFQKVSEDEFSRKVVVIGTCEAVLIFQKGQKSKVDVLKNLCIVAVIFFLSYVDAEYRAEPRQHKGERIAKKCKQIDQDGGL